jgi:hypothetical protein
VSAILSLRVVNGCVVVCSRDGRRPENGSRKVRRRVGPLWKSAVYAALIRQGSLSVKVKGLRFFVLGAWVGIGVV